MWIPLATTVHECTLGNQGKAMADVVAYFGWRFVAVIATTDTYGQNLMNSFQAACTARSITVLSTAQFMSGSDPTTHVQQMSVSLSTATLSTATLLASNLSLLDGTAARESLPCICLAPMPRP